LCKKKPPALPPDGLADLIIPGLLLRYVMVMPEWFEKESLWLWTLVSNKKPVTLR
jgi:hypothetical protein